MVQPALQDEPRLSRGRVWLKTHRKPDPKNSGQAAFRYPDIADDLGHGLAPVEVRRRRRARESLAVGGRGAEAALISGTAGAAAGARLVAELQAARAWLLVRLLVKLGI